MFFGSVACGWTSLLPSSFAIADRLCGGHALVARFVRQPGRSGHVADRPKARDVRAAHGVGIDMALGRFHAQRLQPDVLGVRNDADRDDGMAEAMFRRLSILGLDRRGDDLRVRLQALDAR
jgi:hypothetical protein